MPWVLLWVTLSEDPGWPRTGTVDKISIYRLRMVAPSNIYATEVLFLLRWCRWWCHSVLVSDMFHAEFKAPASVFHTLLIWPLRGTGLTDEMCDDLRLNLRSEERNSPIEVA